MGTLLPQAGLGWASVSWEEKNLREVLMPLNHLPSVYVPKAWRHQQDWNHLSLRIWDGLKICRHTPGSGLSLKLAFTFISISCTNIFLTTTRTKKTLTSNVTDDPWLTAECWYPDVLAKLSQTFMKSFALYITLSCSSYKCWPTNSSLRGHVAGWLSCQASLFLW